MYVENDSVNNVGPAGDVVENAFARLGVVELAGENGFVAIGILAENGLGAIHLENAFSVIDIGNYFVVTVVLAENGFAEFLAMNFQSGIGTFVDGVGFDT